MTFFVQISHVTKPWVELMISCGKIYFSGKYRILIIQPIYMMLILVSVVTSDWVHEEDTPADVHHTIVMKQGAFLAIDSFVRSLYPSSKKSKLVASASAQFLPALLGMTQRLSKTASSRMKQIGATKRRCWVQERQSTSCSVSWSCVYLLLWGLSRHGACHRYQQ